jgi:membrane protease YdiL (CAAX protease family)
MRLFAKDFFSVIEIALVLGLIAGDYYGVVPVSSTPFFVGLGWLSLRFRGLRWRDVGFVRPHSWPQAVIVGTIAGVAIELFATFVTTPLLTYFSGAPPDLSDFRSTVGNFRMLLFWLALNWTLFALGEELAFRGYVMNLFAGAFQSSRAAWTGSLVVTSALFGWSHGNQGFAGIAQESLSGMLLGTLYLASGRNLATPIIAHGISNSLALVLIFFGRYPGI